MPAPKLPNPLSVFQWRFLFFMFWGWGASAATFPLRFRSIHAQSRARRLPKRDEEKPPGAINTATVALLAFGVGNGHRYAANKGLQYK